MQPTISTFRETITQINSSLSDKQIGEMEKEFLHLAGTVMKKTDCKLYEKFKSPQPAYFSARYMGSSKIFIICKKKCGLFPELKGSNNKINFVIDYIAMTILLQRKLLLTEDSKLKIERELEVHSEINDLPLINHSICHFYHEKPEVGLHRSMYVRWCCEGDLFKIIDKGFASHELKVKWICDVIKAVGFLHERNILHRDIKPQNVFIEKGEVRLGDFEYAIKVSEILPDESPSGSAECAAPELFFGTGPSTVTAKSDVWSIGVLAHYVLRKDLPSYAKGNRNSMLWRQTLKNRVKIFYDELKGLADPEPLDLLMLQTQILDQNERPQLKDLKIPW